jgi:hypothetical protein
MIAEEHVIVGVIAQAIARGEDQSPVEEEGKQNSQTRAARHQADSMSGMRFGLCRFSRARLNAAT